MDKEETIQRMIELTAGSTSDKDYFGMSKILDSSYVNAADSSRTKVHLEVLHTEGRLRRIRAINNRSDNFFYRAVIDEK
tara:strand:- start:691 stop:927 length:237 start_codon:yes stop_codon:yes gene_type:complete